VLGAARAMLNSNFAMRLVPFAAYIDVDMLTSETYISVIDSWTDKRTMVGRIKITNIFLTLWYRFVNIYLSYGATRRGIFSWTSG
jgi:hypothetical protein